MLLPRELRRRLGSGLQGAFRVERVPGVVLQLYGQGEPRLCLADDTFRHSLLQVGSGDVAKVSHHQRGQSIYRRFPVVRVLYLLPSFDGSLSVF